MQQPHIRINYKPPSCPHLRYPGISLSARIAADSQATEYFHNMIEQTPFHPYSPLFTPTTTSIGNAIQKHWATNTVSATS